MYISKKNVQVLAPATSSRSVQDSNVRGEILRGFECIALYHSDRATYLNYEPLW